jgi:hypothetical protein
VTPALLVFLVLAAKPVVDTVLLSLHRQDLRQPELGQTYDCDAKYDDVLWVKTVFNKLLTARDARP